MKTKKNRCKAISKSTKERCKNLEFRRGLCKIHQSKDKNLVWTTVGVAAATSFVNDAVDILDKLAPFFMSGNSKDIVQTIKDVEKKLKSDNLSREEQALIISSAKNAILTLKSRSRPKMQKHSAAAKKSAPKKHIPKKKSTIRKNAIKKKSSSLPKKKGR